jgi:hypothetical protein
MNVFTNYLEKLGSNFLVSAMIPSLALVVTSILVFDPIFHATTLFDEQGSIYQLVGSGLLLFILIVIIGFTLTALNTYVLKLFEGYAFFHRVPLIRKRLLRSHQIKANNLLVKRDTLKKRIRKLEQSANKSPRTQNLVRKLREDYYSVSSEYDHSYPSNPDEILPTQFGNILKASEQYPGARYGLDGVEFWPRLIHVIPKEYQQTLDNSRNELSFLVNMSILSLLFYLTCIVAVFYSLYISPVDFSKPELFFGMAGITLRYVIAAALAFVCNVFFYKAAIYSVSSFGLIIRSAYDLFRLDLLKKYKLKLPENSREEFFAWKDLNEFVVLGKHSLTFEQLEYHMED